MFCVSIHDYIIICFLFFWFVCFVLFCVLEIVIDKTLMYVLHHLMPKNVIHNHLKVFVWFLFCSQCSESVNISRPFVVKQTKTKSNSVQLKWR